MAQANVLNNIPAREDLESRFSFIENEILQTNLTITFRYIIFLIAVEDNLRGSISYSLYKDMILHTAMIIESCIHHCIREFISSNIIKSSDVMPHEWKFKNIKEIGNITPDEIACGAIKYKSYERLSDSTQFQNTNKAALNAKILTQDLFERAEDLRNKRNRIHLAALNDVDDLYDKKDVDDTFASASKILDQLEQCLLNIKKT